ncbi:MAG: amino acid-binding protein [Campylobacteraceae bacterium]|nr:amino acid-binding protein [Campylobacteraceae bacterium]
MNKTDYLEQLSIFIENRVGELYSITSLLQKEGISLLSISLSDSSEFGILRLLTKETEKAKNLLIKNGFMAQTNKVIGVRITNQVGSFNNVVKIFNKANIDIRYTYTVNEKNDGIFVFKINDDKFDEATKLLELNGIKTLGLEEL